MNTLRNTFVIVVIVLTLFPSGNVQAGSKADLRNDFTIELLGRCLLYSFSFQHTIEERVGIEAGLSILGGSNGSVTFFSGGARLYPTTKDAAPCIAGGVVAVTASTSSGPFSSDASTAYLYIGPGFEYRSSGGFLFRGTVYFLIHDGFFVWPGVQVGIAF
ncbi:MAG: hypothetical protein HYR76_10750 [Ignavibacteria bacterium]|nr:hypothetical protein [Ignavibacteria bacterium]